MVLDEILEVARRTAYPWDRLRELCDGIGPRLCGSEALHRAERWGADALRSLGLAPRLESVTVPHWVRGAESGIMTAPHLRPLRLLGLGMSVGTPPEGIEAPVAVVRRFDALGPHVAGKIVLYDVPMPERDRASTAYSEVVAYRALGPSRAAGHGAVAVLLRSLARRSLQTPHTGGLRYDKAHPAIPAAALSVEDAELVARLVDRGEDVRVRLTMEATRHEPTVAHNVVADLRGTRYPDEIVLVSGHLDSWDVGQGAQDDGAGVVHTLGTMHVLSSLGLLPRRTIRAVLWTNEENGVAGGKDYASRHDPRDHVALIESDLGAGVPMAWSAAGTSAQVGWLRRVAEPLGMPVEEGFSGVDIGPLSRRGALGIGLRNEDHDYFEIHHTADDTIDNVDPANLREGLAQVAGLTWLLANAEGP